MIRRIRWCLGALLVLALAGLIFAPLPARVGRASRGSLAERLLGPIASLAASAQWVRADLAFRDGRIELFLARARTALSLAPDSAAGWHYLAWHQAFNLGSPEREPDPKRRLAWVQAGLATAAQGERSAEQPEDLAFVAGLILVKVTALDPSLPWPGGMLAAWEAAIGHFERARALGADPSLTQVMIRAARKGREQAAEEAIEATEERPGQR